KKMDALYQAVKKESSSYDNAFEKSRKEFEGKLNSLVGKSDKSLSAFLGGLNVVEKNITDEISKITETATTKTDSLIVKQQNSFNSTIEYLKKYKESIEIISKDLQEFNFQNELEPIFQEVERVEKNILSVIKYEVSDIKKEVHSELKNIHRS